MKNAALLLALALTACKSSNAATGSVQLTRVADGFSQRSAAMREAFSSSL